MVDPVAFMERATAAPPVSPTIAAQMGAVAPEITVRVPKSAAAALFLPAAGAGAGRVPDGALPTAACAGAFAAGPPVAAAAGCKRDLPPLTARGQDRASTGVPPPLKRMRATHAADPGAGHHEPTVRDTANCAVAQGRCDAAAACGTALRQKRKLPRGAGGDEGSGDGAGVTQEANRQSALRPRWS